MGQEVHGPKPRPVAPRCPRYLSKIARREWRRIVPELDRLGLLTCVDGALLEAWCSTYSQMVEAEESIQLNGATFETEKGYVGQRPEIAILNACRKTLKDLAAQLGLSPAGRARMGAAARAEEADEMDLLLRGR